MQTSRQTSMPGQQRGDAAGVGEESVLIARIKAGEKHLFHDLIRPYERSVYLVALSILRNQDDAEDVSQETILKAFMHLEQLREEDKFKGWLLQIATNEARLRRRKDRKHLYEYIDEESAESEDGEFMPRQFADWREIPSEALEREDIRKAIGTALQALPEKYREVFVLRDVQHLGVEETGRALGISIPSVKTRLHRARLMMREQLAPIFRERWTDRLRFWKKE